MTVSAGGADAVMAPSKTANSVIRDLPAPVVTENMDWISIRIAFVLRILVSLRPIVVMELRTKISAKNAISVKIKILPVIQMSRDALPSAKNRITAVTENSAITADSKNVIPQFPAEILDVTMIVPKKTASRAVLSMEPVAKSIRLNVIPFLWMLGKTAIKAEMAVQIAAYNRVINVLEVLRPHALSARVTIPMIIIHVAPKTRDSNVKKLQLAMAMASSIPMATKNVMMAIKILVMVVLPPVRSNPASFADLWGNSVRLYVAMAKS
jgi:hypothetical protein